MAHTAHAGAAGPSTCWSCGGPHHPNADKHVTLYRRASGGWGVVPPVYLAAGTYEMREVVIPFCSSCRRGPGASNVELLHHFLVGSVLLGATWAAGALAWRATEVEQSAIIASVVTFVLVGLALRLLMRSRADRTTPHAADPPDARRVVAALGTADPLAIREYPVVQQLLATGWGLSTVEADRAAARRRPR